MRSGRPPRLARPARLARLVCLAGLPLVAAAQGGCSLDECAPLQHRCAGTLAQDCQNAGESQFYAWETLEDCASQGQVCRDGATRAECVFGDRPCSVGSCAAGVATRCGSSGFVTSTQICDSDATCEVNETGAACVYTQATCDSKTEAFCGADGVTVYRGCDAGFGAATYRAVCDGSTPHCVPLGNDNATCKY
jgi:hypothetical protein